MDCGLRTTDCGMGIIYGLGHEDYGLGIKYGVRPTMVKTVIIGSR